MIENILPVLYCHFNHYGYIPGSWRSDVKTYNNGLKYVILRCELSMGCTMIILRDPMDYYVHDNLCLGRYSTVLWWIRTIIYRTDHYIQVYKPPNMVSESIFDLYLFMVTSQEDHFADKFLALAESDPFSCDYGL